MHPTNTHVAPKPMPPSCSFLCPTNPPPPPTHPCEMWFWNFWFVVVVVVVVKFFDFCWWRHRLRTDRQTEIQNGRQRWRNSGSRDPHVYYLHFIGNVRCLLVSSIADSYHSMRLVKFQCSKILDVYCSRHGIRLFVFDRCTIRALRSVQVTVLKVKKTCENQTLTSVGGNLSMFSFLHISKWLRCSDNVPHLTTKQTCYSILRVASYELRITSYTRIAS